ncbi:MAG: glycine betaine ABC transporter substrate-binding protein [Pseudomonadota bacterium]
MQTSLLSYLMQQAPLLGMKTIEQIYLVLVSVVIALIIGIPLGIFTARYKSIKTFILRTVSTLWTIPSLALLAFFIPFFGIGFKPAIITLAIYALLPILRNTVAGIENIPAENVEIARGMGFTNWQRLWMVEVPLAMPVIMSGIRTAVSITVGVATLAAFIGAGGLGDFINQGLALNDTRLILLGAIPAALLALIFDFIIARIEAFIWGKRNITMKQRKKRVRFLGVLLVILSLGFFLVWHYYINPSYAKVVRIGTKNFTEQFVLGELMAQMIENHTDIHVERKFNLGSTAICQQAMLNGSIDMYPEYTGTAYLLVLHKKLPKNSANMPEKIYTDVKQDYAKQFHIIWLAPFGFNNTEALVLKQKLAAAYNLNTISNLVAIAPRLIVAGPAELLERPDGLKGLRKAYGLKFKSIRQMDPGLMYKALESNAVDVLAGFSTDGRIIQYHLKVLIDNKHFYPPYYAAPLIRAATLKKYPQIAKALAPLANAINDKTMQQLNYQVDVLKRSPAQVAHAFLLQRGLIKD